MATKLTKKSNGVTLIIAAVMALLLLLASFATAEANNPSPAVETETASGSHVQQPPTAEGTASENK
jgi:uncharacterized low-complexity protein